MTLLELNKSILNNTNPYTQITKTFDISNVIEILTLYSDLFDHSHLKDTMSSTEFWTSNPMFNAVVDGYSEEKNIKVKEFKKEIFFTLKLECYSEDVSSELLMLLMHTKNKTPSPNRMIAHLDKLRFSKFIKEPISKDTAILKKIINTIYEYDVELLTKDKPLVENKDIIEIYIENIDYVLLCNKQIHNIISSIDDIKNLYYDKEKGIVLKDGYPLRFKFHPYGLVEDDLDLRKVLLKNDV